MLNAIGLNAVSALMLLGFVAAIVAYVAATRASENFTWTPPGGTPGLPKGTYAFGAPSSATELDKILGKIVNPFIPKDVLDGAGEPEPRPHADSETEDVAKAALARVDRPLEFVNVESAAGGTDKNKNVYHDITMLVYDKKRAAMTKLSLVAVVTKGGKTYIRKFSTFSGTDTGPDGLPGGSSDFSFENAPYEERLGIDYNALYK